MNVVQDIAVCMNLIYMQFKTLHNEEATLKSKFNQHNLWLNKDTNKNMQKKNNQTKKPQQ